MHSQAWKLFLLIVAARFILDNFILYKQHVVDNYLVAAVNLFHCIIKMYVNFGWLLLFNANYLLVGILYITFIIVATASGLLNNGCVISHYTKKISPSFQSYSLLNMAGLQSRTALYFEYGWAAVSILFTLAWILNSDLPLLKQKSTPVCTPT